MNPTWSEIHAAFLIGAVIQKTLSPRLGKAVITEDEDWDF
jgi:hypothetical protein